MTNDVRDQDAFIRQIADLDIDLSVSAEGVYTVCTHAEPFFCYDADSKEEAANLVSETLVSYAKHFHGLDLKQPRVEDQESTGSITIERGTPIGQLKPVFDLAA